ncbi:PBP1A family penicillin-binding protein [Gallaecimonas kandeliae]|nr:PBP1A family penicillin-binding protein [Gallaecimonas kandeliae]WKE67517.1 PBP1A family penicillin-binding protein [Gallaecimonas kandeliae]
MALLGVASVVGMYYYVKPELPSVAVLKDVRLQTPMRVYSADGELISQFGEKRRIPLAIKDMPPQLVQAFLATEDSRFYEHSGIDFVGLARAAVNLVLTGHKSQGASTITMQLARNFFLTREKTYIRKIKEMFIAWHIEQLLTKDEILELYLNKIELGHRAFGVGAAAQVYYGKDVKDLTLPEMAVLAGLPKAPSTLNPLSNPERAMARRNVVLGRMLDVGAVTQAQYDQAIKAPNTASYHGAEITLSAHYVAEMVRQQMIDLFGEDAAYGEGYQVYTTLNAKDQRAAQQALINNVLNYDRRHGWRGPAQKLEGWPWDQAKIDQFLKGQDSYQPLIPAVVTAVGEQSATVQVKGKGQLELPWEALSWARAYIDENKQGPAPKSAGEILAPGDLVYVRPNGEGWLLAQIPMVNSALVALDPHDGAIRALVGGFNFELSKYNRVTQAKRQVGSNIKPFIYSAALDNGFTLASLVNDAPINQWDRSQGYAWRPKNSPPVYLGPTRVRIGLGQSKNVMSVRLLRAVGIDKVINRLTDFGFDRDDLPRNESLALGSASLTPMDVARGFSAIANGGFLVEPYLVDRVEDGYGKLVWMASPKVACSECEQLLAQGAADQPVTLGAPTQALAAAPADQEEALSAAFASLQGQPEVQDQGNWQQQCEVAPVGANRLAKRAISAQTAFLVTQAMESVIWGGGNWSHGTGWTGTGWRAARELKRHDIAGKTGTTNESKDAWFSGFIPGLEATTWIGFDDHQHELGGSTNFPPLADDPISGKEAGAKSAQPGWNAFMKVALAKIPEGSFAVPPGIVSVRIDRATGKLTRATDFSSRFEYFKAGTEPTEFARDSLANPFDAPPAQDKQNPDDPDLF